MIRRLIVALAHWILSLTYKKLTKDQINGKLIELVPGIKVDGKPLYKFVNEIDMPISRKVMLFAHNEWLIMKLTPEEIIKFIDGIRLANNEGDKSKVGALAYMLNDIVSNLTPRTAFYHMASVLYFFEDEDISNYDGDLALMKIEAFKNMHDQSFFFRTLLRHLSISDDTSESDMLKALTQSQAILQSYQQQLSEMFPADELTNSTKAST